MTALTSLRAVQDDYQHIQSGRWSTIIDYLLTATGTTVKEIEHAGNSDDAPNARNPQAIIEALKDLLTAVPATTWMELATTLGKTRGQTRALATRILKGRFLLPRLTTAMQSGNLSFDLYDHTTTRAQDIEASSYDYLDQALTLLAPTTDATHYRATLTAAITLLKTPEHSAEHAFEERGVHLTDLGNGLGLLELTGPIHTLTALEARLRAFARLIRTGDPVLLEEADSHTITDDRNLGQLMFDILINTPHSLDITVTEVATAASSEAPAGDTQESDATNNADGQAPAQLVDAIHQVTVTIPRNDSWLASQAQVATTVPFLTLTGDEPLPGQLAGKAPIPADIASHLASQAPSLRRLLTDPATGAVLDEHARSYHIPTALRTTLQNKWAWCTAPGCTRPAQTCDLDHIEPFNHADPAAGGPTTTANLHPLCRGHHLLKTNRNITITTGKDDSLTYTWTSTTAPTGFTHTIDPPPDLINAAQARHIIDQLTGTTSYPPNPPPEPQGTTVPTDPAASEPAPPDPGLYPLERNLRALSAAERAIPAIADLEHLLAQDHLLPPRPERKLTTWEELDILYRIAHPDHTTPRPKTWRPTDWTPWAHHRTRTQIITDPWRHTTPPIDHQTEYETDLPPF
ncbi:HNH endonuclease [Brevibacterium sp. 91QC2O2]|uniref:HNH endonuclease signature motif containing protein n=1 Tax=Brevibacterium sp. 91QC2O2 TaxID=2968458 RepID=UPI00211C0C07|nr:HNH endonuclease signature motif containing protein [Brevibacterium sp. 91QC2O2]MCQ9367153.1 HNH endonuclease [Brevibacterium sp. 91QC2O2]